MSMQKKCASSSPTSLRIIRRNHSSRFSFRRSRRSLAGAKRTRNLPTELTRLSLAWHIPEITNPDVPALDLLSTILGDGRSSRLVSARARRERVSRFSISAFSYTPGDPGLLGIDATVDPEKREAAAAISPCKSSTKSNKLASRRMNLTKAKKILLSHHLGALTTMRGQASDLGSNWLLTRNLNFSRDYLDAVQKVTLDDIQRVAAALPDGEQSDHHLAESERLARRQKQKVESRSRPVRFRSSNFRMACVFWFAKIRVCRLCRWRAVFRGGLLAETPQDNGITQLMAKVLLKGTKTRTAEQIADTNRSGRRLHFERCRAITASAFRSMSRSPI